MAFLNLFGIFDVVLEFHGRPLLEGKETALLSKKWKSNCKNIPMGVQTSKSHLDIKGALAPPKLEI